jgi:O-antigen biosynthesis protein
VRDVTVILTGYKRPELLEDQVEAIRSQTIPPRELWVWANEPGPEMRSAIERAAFDRVIGCSKNAYVHARFALALLVTSDFVALFDDDTLPGRRWLENCLQTFDRTPGILGSAGVRLWSEGYQNRSVHGWHDPQHETVEVDLVGHAWFLKAEWVRYLFAAPAVTGANGEDIELCGRAWRLGGIRTFCPPHPPEDRSRWGSLRGEVLGNDPVALSRRPSHLEERSRIVRAEIAAGWKPCYQRSASTSEPKADAPAHRRTIAFQPSVLEGRNATLRHVVVDTRGPGPDTTTSVEPLPVSGQRLLVIGPNVGAQAESLKARKPARLAGIELDPSRLTKSRERLDEVFASDANGELPEFPDGSFDGILCESLLEQVRRPQDLLRQFRRWLAPKGMLSASVQNLRRNAVVAGLLSGRWEATSVPDGAPRPLRFFTRRELEKQIIRAGFSLPKIEVVPGPGHEEWVKFGRPGELKVGQLHVGGMPVTEVEEFYTDAYRLRAVPAAELEMGMTSIVILTHNQLDYSRQCLDSIRRYTDESYEIIVVDNASTDGTVEFLRSCADVQLIVNTENCGFPAAVNQGIAVASGRQILLLNNDTVVTTGWLARMLQALESDPRIGLVGPCSNCVGSAQQIAVGYDALTGLDGFAWEWGKTHDRVIEDTDRLIGFCLLIRRELVDRIGLLDERFGIGCYEDDDYCRRAIHAGYRAVVARDSFVHHYGGRSFIGSGVDFSAVMQRNQQLYEAKWAESARDKPPAPSTPPRKKPGPFTVTVAPGGGLLLKRIRLSLCMIVRDSSRTLPACLESIKPWVDEMVIVDTGSKDNTPQIVEEFGARLFNFPWCDDFSAARNESFRHGRGDWLFWMDSDDTIPADCGRRLRELADGHHDPSVVGYVVQVHCPGEDDSDVTVVDHAKLIRNRGDLRFEGRIHEQILPAIRRCGGEVAWTDLYVVHSGSDHSQEAQERKRQRDLHLLHLELRERPEHPFTLFNLGMTYADGSRFDEAAGFLQRSIARSNPQESHLRKAYALLVYCQAQSHAYDAAEQTCRKGLALFPEDAELRFREGVLLHETGHFQESVQAYENVLRNHEERHFSSLDPGIKGFKARQNLAVVHTDLGDLAAAEKEWRLITQERPKYRDGWRGLGDTLLRQVKLDEAWAMAEPLLSDRQLRGDAMVLRGRIAAARGDFKLAHRLLDQAVTECPEDLEPLRALCQFLFERGERTDAEQALTSLVQRAPDDASAHHNLGTLLLQRKRYTEAIQEYRQALRHRADAPSTYLQLGYALKENGQIEEAVAAWQQVLRLAPDDQAAHHELEHAGLLVCQG